MRRPILILLSIAAGGIALSACSTEMTVRMPDPVRLEGPMMVFEGYYISDELFERIRVNETTTDWVIALLGRPTEEAILQDGSLVWKWVYREQGFNTSMLSLTGKDEEKPSLPQLLTFVRIQDGVVIDKWRG